MRKCGSFDYTRIKPSETTNRTDVVDGFATVSFAFVMELFVEIYKI